MSVQTSVGESMHMEFHEGKDLLAQVAMGQTYKGKAGHLSSAVSKQKEFPWKSELCELFATKTTFADLKNCFILQEMQRNYKSIKHSLMPP